MKSGYQKCWRDGQAPIMKMRIKYLGHQKEEIIISALRNISYLKKLFEVGLIQQVEKDYRL